MPAAFAAATLSLPYNDLDAVRAAFARYPGEIAAVAVEPVAGNMGVVPAASGYLEGLRELCDRHGPLLLFDEVMTGFRVAWGGAQVRYGIKPDLTCLGKVIGGGLPCAAYGGPKRLMEQVSPAGSVYQAGTLSGNPLAMAGGLATLEILGEPDAYDRLERKAAMLEEGLIEAAGDAGVPLAVNRVGSMLTPFFVKTKGQPVRNYADATACDTGAYASFFHAMLEEGVHLAPSQYEAMFVGLAHKKDLIEQTIKAARRAFKAVASRTGA